MKATRPPTSRHLRVPLVEEAGARVMTLGDSAEGEAIHDRDSNEEPPARG
jgi:hypothetical protein